MRGAEGGGVVGYGDARCLRPTSSAQTVYEPKESHHTPRELGQFPKSVMMEVLIIRKIGYSSERARRRHAHQRHQGRAQLLATVHRPPHGLMLSSLAEPSAQAEPHVLKSEVSP